MSPAETAEAPATKTSKGGTRTKERGEAVPIQPSYVVTEPEIKDVISLENIERVKDKTVKLDSNMAKWFLDLPTFPGERPRRKGHVRTLMRAILRKTYLPEDVTLNTCIMGKKEYRINGQHTCAAILSINTQHHEKQIAPQVRYIQYRARNMAELKALYASKDQGAARTPSNQIVSLLSGVSGFDETLQDIIRRMAEGLKMRLSETNHQRRENDPQVIANLMMGEYKDASIHIGRLFGEMAGEHARHLKKAAVIAAMYYTYQSAPKLARTFWVGVRDGEGLQGKANPILMLRDHLKDIGLRNRGRSADKMRIPSEHLLRQALHCWNAYRKDVKLDKGLNTQFFVKDRPQVL